MLNDENTQFLQRLNFTCVEKDNMIEVWQMKCQSGKIIIALFDKENNEDVTSQVFVYNNKEDYDNDNYASGYTYESFDEFINDSERYTKMYNEKTASMKRLRKK
jgi:hypothetical protein